MRRARVGDAPLVAGVLADAFEADPFFRWMFGPDPGAAWDGIRAWLDLLVGLALPRGEGWIAESPDDTQDDGPGDPPRPPVGAALWLPPGVDVIQPDELAAVARLLDERVGERAPEVIAAIGASDGPVPHVAHWLCLYIGVVPAFQGRGLGRLLLEPGLRAADEMGVPAHLVSTNADTAPFYERFGFRVLAEIAAAPGVPALRPMWRDARGAGDRP